MSQGRKWPPVPREHGAWGMLAQPFLGALIVSALKGRVSGEQWFLAIAAASAAVLVFLIREPLLVVARQKWVWKDRRPETAEAWKWVAIEMAVLAAVSVWLASVWPVWLMLALASGAAVLTWLAVWMTIRNKQRAVWFQGLGAAGLSASGLAACLAVTGGVAPWAWWWWGLHTAHFFAGILVVHVRLEARIAARKGAGMTEAFFTARKETAVIEALLGIAGLVMMATGFVWFGAAAVASAAWHFWNLFTADRPAAIAMAMTSVGKRALVASLVFTVVVGVGAWRLV